jgi:hypothetical protein
MTHQPSRQQSTSYPHARNVPLAPIPALNWSRLAGIEPFESYRVNRGSHHDFFSSFRRRLGSEDLDGSHNFNVRFFLLNRSGLEIPKHRTSLALAEWLCRTVDRIDPARVCGPFHCFGRRASAPHSASLCWLLQQHQNVPVIG